MWCDKAGGFFSFIWHVLKHYLIVSLHAVSETERVQWRVPCFVSVGYVCARLQQQRRRLQIMRVMQGSAPNTVRDIHLYPARGGIFSEKVSIL